MKAKTIKVIINYEDNVGHQFRVETQSYFFDQREPIHIIDGIIDFNNPSKFPADAYDYCRSKEDDIGKGIEDIAKAFSDAEFSAETKDS